MTIIIILSVLTLAGGGMLFVGIRGIITRRASIYSGKWLLALVALCFLPQFLNGFRLLPRFPSAALLNILMYPFLLLIFWAATKGYICFGVSEEMIADGLKTAFGGLALKYEQLLGSVKLEDGGIFQISIQGWMGTMQIKAKNRQAAARMPGLIAALSQHFASYDSRIRFMPYWIYTVCGGMIAAALLTLLSVLARQPRIFHV
jgi:hypothetical protein